MCVCEFDIIQSDRQEFVLSIKVYNKKTYTDTQTSGGCYKAIYYEFNFSEHDSTGIIWCLVCVLYSDVWKIKLIYDVNDI
jgi:hypothetical protein